MSNLANGTRNTIAKDNFTLCDVEGDGWCLYRALLVAKYIHDHLGSGCDSAEVLKIKKGNDAIIKDEIQKIADYIKKKSEIKDAIALLIAKPDNQIDHDAEYYKSFGIKDVETYITAMTNDKKFFGDAQIVANAFGNINEINVNVYEPAEWKIPGNNPGSVITIKEPENYRKSYPDTVAFPGKPFLHIYHGGRIHYQAMIPNTVLEQPVEASAAAASPLQPQPQSAVALQQQQQQPIPGRPTPENTVTLTIGPNTYNLPVGEDQDHFRSQLFERMKTTQEHTQLLALLTNDEQAILRDMGFLTQSQFMIDHAQYMAEFFKALPQCTTETSVMLNKQCDTSYFLIFALLHAAAQEASTQMETQGEFVGDEELLRKGATASFFGKRLQPGQETDGEVKKFALKLIKLKNPNKSGVSALLTSYANLKQSNKSNKSNKSNQSKPKTDEEIINELFTLYI